MRQRSWSPFVVFSLLLFSLTSFQTLDAQPLSIRGSVGFAHLPLPAWSKFWSQGQDGSHYQQNNPNVYYALSVQYALSEHHSINLGTELLKTTASLSQSFGNTLEVVDWQFQGTPLSVGYEYRLLAFNEHFIPVAGVGFSYFFSQLEASETLYHQRMKRTGKGYGVYGSLGLITEMTQSLSMVTQLRYRYSNGMAFSDRDGDIKVEFTGVDVSAGLAWTF